MTFTAKPLLAITLTLAVLAQGASAQTREHILLAGSGFKTTGTNDGGTRGGGWTCGPSASVGVCGLPTDMQSNICEGRGGTLSDTENGGTRCTVKD